MLIYNIFIIISPTLSDLFFSFSRSYHLLMWECSIERSCVSRLGKVTISFPLSLYAVWGLSQKSFCLSPANYNRCVRTSVICSLYLHSKKCLWHRVTRFFFGAVRSSRPDISFHRELNLIVSRVCFRSLLFPSFSHTDA